MLNSEVIVVCCGDNMEFARELAGALGKSLLAAPDELATGFALEVTDSGLQLRDLCNRRYRPLRLDFERTQIDGSTRNHLKRALGPGVESVVDVTAGWGSDALKLVRCGLQVTALEREPVVVKMLAEAWQRCEDPIIRENLRIEQGDGAAWLSTLESAPDAVYMDPMFPEKRKKSAAARKEMSILQRLVGPDDDAADLLESAIRTARLRVVVKRPGYSPPLTGPAPAGSVSGKLVRFDIYSAATR